MRSSSRSCGGSPLAGLFAAGEAVEPVHVLSLLLVRAVGGAFHQPAMAASTTLMVPPQHFTRIQGINQSAQGLLLIVGAPLGGLLFGILPMAGVMLVDVGTALLAIGPLLVTRVPEPPRPQVALGEVRASVWADARAGLRYLRVRPGHLGIVLLAAAMNLLLAPAFALMRSGP
jgi:DHA3 family macrolide efflux protein-like MFS transporter